MGKAHVGALGIPWAVDLKRNPSSRLFAPTPIQRSNSAGDFHYPLEPMGRVAQVAAGWNQSLFLDVDGGVWSAGKGYMGGLGHRTFEDQHAPKRVRALFGHRVVRIASGQHHSVALTGRCRGQDDSNCER